MYRIKKDEKVAQFKLEPFEDQEPHAQNNLVTEEQNHKVAAEVHFIYTQPG